MRFALIVTCGALFALPVWGAEKFTSKPTAFKEIALNSLAEYEGLQQDQGRDNVGLALEILSGRNRYPNDTVETMGSTIFINSEWKKIAKCRYSRISGQQFLEGINISYEI